jgi:hypothetical protein
LLFLSFNKVVVGKAHIVALTKEGDIFTFGMNNKGQCGRDFPPAKESSADPNLAASSAIPVVHTAAVLAAEGVDDLGSDPDVDVDHEGNLKQLVNSAICFNILLCPRTF